MAWECPRSLESTFFLQSSLNVDSEPGARGQGPGAKGRGTHVQGCIALYGS